MTSSSPTGAHPTVYGHLWWEEAGDDDQPLVALVHGSMDRSSGMLKVSRRLDHRYRVLRYDRRGYGRSRPHPGPFGMDGQVADLAYLLGGRRAVLVGHSYGGNVVLAAAARHPELVAGVAVYETPLSWEEWWPGGSAGAAAMAAADRPEEAAEGFMRRMVGEERWEALPERTKAARRAEGVAMVAELADLRAHRPWLAADVRVPAVASFGTEGLVHHRRGMTHVAESIAGCRLVALDGARHDAPLGAPDQFCREVVEPLLEMVGGPWA